MYRKERKLQGIFFSLVLMYPLAGMSSDLDDGIPLDTPVDDSLKTGVNIPYVLMKAKGRELSAKRNKSNTLITDKDANAVGQGNIILGPGAKLGPGAVIINNSDNRGATAVAK
ncbi:hypothetical protein Nhal_1722 [Nitrosococcus halophilus Nc 4]|uniref:Uncharacterized protein n=1 Tax=Nitrosococcus halophilus (strain Nc4) TaxID=472759 RepID=D5C2I7_NITHN|nr:hypothetical protein [Nitrosococcus halophilus]ADE14846.1 hypothetical protein Nhal_1722 [Nitrosococcus halophilus Nc 4]